jgi:hypothetical protein
MYGYLRVRQIGQDATFKENDIEKDTSPGLARVGEYIV